MTDYNEIKMCAVDLQRYAEKIMVIEEKLRLKTRVINHSTLKKTVDMLSLCAAYPLPCSELGILGVDYIMTSQGFRFIITKSPAQYLSNRKTKYTFENKYYMVLSTGGVGRLLFTGVNHDNYGATDAVWGRFVRFLEGHKALEYDTINGEWVYEMEDGIELYSEFPHIIKEYQSEFDAVLREYKISLLQKQLNQLIDEKE